MIKAQNLASKGRLVEAREEYARLYELEPENISLAKEYIKVLYETNEGYKAAEIIKNTKQRSEERNSEFEN